MIKKENLDKRICDVEENATNEQTLREFLSEAEITFFGRITNNFDSMNNDELYALVEEYDYLYMK